jgi:hypothetical protein
VVVRVSSIGPFLVRQMDYPSGTVGPGLLKTTRAKRLMGTEKDARASEGRKAKVACRLAGPLPDWRMKRFSRENDAEQKL